MEDILNKLSKSLSMLMLVLSCSTTVVSSCACTDNGYTENLSETEHQAVENGWLDPLARRNLQIFNVFFSVVLLLLSGVSLYLRRALKEKVAGLEKTRRQLEEQNKLLRLVTENTTEGIWDFDVETESGTLSREWYVSFGYEPPGREMALSEWHSFVHPDDLTASKAALSAFIEAGGKGQYDSEMRIRRADGTWCWMLSRGRTVSWDADGRPSRVIGLHLDIQKIRDAQQKIQQKEEKFRKLFQYCPVPLIISSKDGNIIAVNDRMTAVLGYTVEDIPTVEDCWRLAYPEGAYRAQLTDAWQSAVEKARTTGSSIAPLESRVTGKDRRERTMIVEGTIIDESLLISLYDITDHRRAEDERKKLREQLLQAQKLEAVGVLAGGVAHDFNNMIGAIMGYSELILGQLDADSPHRDYQERILDAAHRSASLTRQLLAFARKQSVAPVVLDLNQAVESMLKLLRRLIGENIELKWLPGNESYRVRIDPSQLDQLLANLCVNARDAILDVGIVTLETDSVSFDERYCEKYSDFKPGTFAVLTVSDNGQGMDGETLQRIFEPFFTTKKLGQGTGMGLATVYGITKQNGGFITVYSEPGQGTAFRLYLPLQSEQPAAKRTGNDDSIPLGRGETILLVEDDATLLEMTGAMLKNLGYTVLAADTPGAALNTARDFKGQIHLFMTDVIMPEMNGRELSELLLGMRPSIRYLYMSGYTANVISGQGGVEEGVPFLQKPFLEKDLAVKVRSALE